MTKNAPMRSAHSFPRWPSGPALSFPRNDSKGTMHHNASQCATMRYNALQSWETASVKQKMLFCLASHLLHSVLLSIYFYCVKQV